MKNIKRILIALLLAIVMVFGVAGCNAGTQNDLQSKIDELQSQIEEMTDRLAEMEDQISERDEKIEQLEKELAEKSLGTFYSLQEAYDKGYLTKTDIKDICYYRFGEVWEGDDLKSENWIKVEYTPTRSLTDLDKKIETAIKATYYKLNEDLFYSKDEGKIGGINDLTVKFFGEFSNSYVVVVNCSLWDYGTVSTPMVVAGIAWWESGDGFKVFRAE